MQTLRIDFKAVFENLPGRNILVLPDPPFFTIAGISNVYCRTASLKRNDVIGKPFKEVLNSENQKHIAFSVSDLLDSMERVLIEKQPHVVVLSELIDRNSHTERRFIKASHTPISSKEGEILYIVHNVSIIPGNELPVSLEITQSNVDGSPRQDANLQSIIMQAPVAMGVLRGTNMVIETANDHMLNLWGKDQSVIGQPVLNALPEINAQPFPSLLKKVFETGIEHYGFETEAILQRGGALEKCYFNFVYAPLRDNQDIITGVMVVASDVTSQVKAKKELEESEKRYRDLITNATVATAIYIGKHMEIRLANDAMLQLWGKDRSVIGKPLKDAIPELEGQPFFKLLDNVFATGETYHSSEDRAELVVNGQLQSFYFNFTYKALRDTTGHIYGILNMAVDVSEIVKAKIKIKDAEEGWRIALNSAELGTWDYYPSTKEIICSARTKELFGLREKSPITFDQLINAINIRDRERVLESVANIFKGASGEVHKVEYHVVGIDDQKERWQRATGTAFFNDDGVAYRITGTVLDITESKSIEEELEERVQLRTAELLDANKELERSNRELEQYAYVASHDLQEPLRKILVYADLLKKGKTNSAMDQVKLDKIVSSAQRMSHLIKDLLNFSRLLKTENIYTTVDLNYILGNVFDDFELKIQETNARIIMGKLPSIEASMQQMNQLFYNLISNALKFRKERVPLIIEVTATPVPRSEIEQRAELNPELSYTDVCISDNGIGFKSRYVKQIFEIFKRLHPTARFEGTGIGLALCRKIVLNHHGDIYAVSQEGVGAAFHLLLPLKQPPKGKFITGARTLSSK